MSRNKVIIIEVNANLLRAFTVEVKLSLYPMEKLIKREKNL